MSIIRLLKCDEYLDNKLHQVVHSSLSVNVLKYSEYNLGLLREMEKQLNIDPVDVEFRPLAPQLFQNIKKAFESAKTEPQDVKQLQQLYIGMIKHLAHKDTITTTRSIKAADMGGLDTMR